MEERKKLLREVKFLFRQGATEEEFKGWLGKQETDDMVFVLYYLMRVRRATKEGFFVNWGKSL